MKELWFAEYERYIQELIDVGMSEDDAIVKADEDASKIYDRAIGRIADQADALRHTDRE